MYTELLKVYRDLEAQHGVPEEHALKFPKYYGADVKHMEETLVLEDLTSSGFGSANRFESVDWQYAAAAITELAKFHALSFAYQHYYPSQFDQFINTLPCGMVKEDEQSLSVFQNAVKSALTAVRDENKEKLNEFLENRNVGAYAAMFKPLKREVLIHTDFRPNNMLHKITDNGTVEVIPVDYQTAQKGSPVIDLLYFIFTATDGQFRAKYYQKLVDHYHSQLVTALARFGLNADEKYSKEDLEFEMKEKLSFGLQLSIIALPLLTIPEDEAPQLESSLDLSSMVGMFGTTSDLCIKRLNDVVDNYVEWGILK